MDRISNPVFLVFPGGSNDKESAGDLGSTPGLGRSPGGGHGNPLQCFCLEGYSPWGHKESDTAERLNSTAQAYAEKKSD